MATSKDKQKEFNDRMNRITSKYQRIYQFEVSKDKPGHSTWNNEADAFKHTFGSALMAFELGNFGSIAGGIIHEFQTQNNPKDEWNMDSWNNYQGRKIAEEIKKEYGEKNFRSFSQTKQEDIIAKKVMDKMKNGSLITHPNDKREYDNWFEKKVYDNKKQQDEKETKEAKKIKRIFTGFAANIENEKNVFANNTHSASTNIVDIHEDYYKTKYKSSAYVRNNFAGVEMNGKKWEDWADKERNDFIEGFDTGQFTNEGIKHAKLQEKMWTKNFNIGNPDTDKGHWITLPNGKHIFIKD